MLHGEKNRMIHVGILMVSLAAPSLKAVSPKRAVSPAFAAPSPPEETFSPLLRAVSACLPPDAFVILRRAEAPSDEGEIAMQLLALCDAGCDLVLTTGGVGFAPSDVTPEATVSVLDRNAPGIAELLRTGGDRSVKDIALSRGVAGMHGQTLIVNLPANPEAVRQNLNLLVPLLPHVVSLLRGEAVA